MAVLKRWTGTAWEVVDAPAPANMATTDTAQTISGAKTFTSAPEVPDNSFGIAKISATGTRSTATFLRGDGTFATPAYPAVPVTSVNTRTGAVTGLAEANAVVALTGNQTVAGIKTFTSEIVGPATGNVLKVGDDARLADINVAHVMGIVSQSDVNQGGVQFGSTAGNFRLSGAGTAGTATGSLNVTTTLSEAGNRVYSLGNKVPVAGISATGTADANVYLRGDGTWSSPAGGVTSVNSMTGAVMLTAADLGGTTLSTPSTLAMRDASGDINARLFRSEYDTTNASINFIMTQIDTATNNYLRPSTPAQVAAGLRSSLISEGVLTSDTIGNTYRGYTTSTAGTYVNQWARILTITLTSRYSDGTVRLRIIGNGSGHHTAAATELVVRLKQQEAMGSAPTYSLYAGDFLAGFAANRLTLVITSNTATETVGELWMQAPNGWEQYSFQELIQSRSGGSTITYMSNSPWQVALPVGPAITATALLPNNNDDLVHKTATETVSGRKIFSGTTGADYTTAALELYYAGSGVKPSISFHMGGVVASQISMASDGTIEIANNPGTGYEKFRAGTIYEGANRVYSAGHAPPYPVTSVAGRTGAVTLAVADVANAVSTAQLGAASGVATLDASGKLLAAQTPAIAITDTFVVASQAAMLALTAEVGDVAIRTDTNTSYILRAAGAATLANWELLRTPTDAVQSVNGRTGVVTGLAENNTVVHLTGTETITGTKTFSGPLTAQLLTETSGSERPLRRFHEALALTAFEPCDIISIGASVDEGYYAVTDEQRYISWIRRTLQSRFNPSGVSGGEGYIPARHTHESISAGGYAGPPQRWTFAGGWAVQANWTYGIGRRYAMLDSATETATITFTGDRFWLLYIRGTSVGAFNVTINANAPILVDAYAATLGTGLYDSGPLPYGTYTVKVQPTAGGANPTTTTRLTGLDGIMTFNGDGGASAGLGKGVRWWDSAHSGYKAIDFNNTTWMTGLSHVQPDLVTINFGGNEYLQGSTSASFDTNLRGLITKIRAQVSSNPSIALIKMYDISDLTGYTVIEPWENYEAVINQVALDTGCAIIDLGERMSPAPSAAGSSLFAENIHPAPPGMLAMANEISDFLIGTRVTRVATSELSATGTPDATTYLRGDNTWAVVEAGSGSIEYQTEAPTSPAVGDVWIDADEDPVVSDASGVSYKRGFLMMGA